MENNTNNHSETCLDEKPENSSKEFNLGFDVRIQRVLLSIKRAIKKSYFYEGGIFPYEFSNFDVQLNNGLIKIQNSAFPEKLFEIIKINSIIRKTDDILDNVLAKQIPFPKQEMLKVITEFEHELPSAFKVAELFRKEINLLSGTFKKNEIEGVIKEIIEIRPSDFFLLTDTLNTQFGTHLSKKEYNYGKEFYHTFQTLRDLLDDIMSIEEDINQKDYNSIVIGKLNSISFHFFDDIIIEKFRRLNEISNEFTDHKFKYLFKPTIEFWMSQYSLIFKPLLISYYIDIEEFRANYFMIKQV